MEKIILKNGQEFYVPQLGVVSNDITKRRRITIKTDMDYNDILAIMSDKDNISRITYALENGTVITIYADCVSLKSLTRDFDNSTYTAEFGTDATERIVQELQAKVEQMQQTIDALTKAPADVPADEPVPTDEVSAEEPEPEEPEDDEPEGTPEEPADETTDEPEETPEDEPTEEAEEPEDNTDSEPAEP